MCHRSQGPRDRQMGLLLWLQDRGMCEDQTVESRHLEEFSPWSYKDARLLQRACRIYHLGQGIIEQP